MKKTKKYVIPEMFDVRPVNSAGDLDLEKIKKVRKIVKIESKRHFPSSNKKIGGVFYDIKRSEPSVQLEFAIRPEPSMEPDIQVESQFPIQQTKSENYLIRNDDGVLDEQYPYFADSSTEPEQLWSDFDYSVAPEYYQPNPEETDYFRKFEDAPESKLKDRNEYFSFVWLAMKNKFWKSSYWRFASAAFCVMILFFCVNIAFKGGKVKGVALDNGQKAYASLMEAKSGIESNNIDRAKLKFSEADKIFTEISAEFDSFGSVVIEVSKYIPYTSKLATGAHLSRAGKDISQIGINLSSIIETLNNFKNPLNQPDQSFSMLDTFQDIDKNIKETSLLVDDLEDNLKDVNLDDLPESQREKIGELQAKLPQIKDYLKAYLADNKIFTDVLGGNGPRKYLILFQNNQEMRATGGFIGTYALVDVASGKIRNFKIDGIFNPDGQLREKIVPPAPIQKISAAWSLHDSNWFPNFPTTAEKAAWFFQKTGGPTVDGVITMTPAVIQRFLEITGPIDMPGYGVTIDKNNFLEKIQEEVEVNYNKELNQPKKILADLAPKILDRVFDTKDLKEAAKIMNVLSDSLNEKQILIYSKNYDIEKTLSENGWSGEVLKTQKDYISVINTNINGYKTDGVVEEKITHQAEIQEDGSIIDTVTIIRHHNGGNTPYEWWNKVNSDYMRVYVPQGSKLISASGQTREFNSAPLDYDALGFKRDAQIKMEEDSMEVDEESGTRIYNDSGKTVFANWVYVSPQETVEVKYSYLLPFRITAGSNNKPVDTYSLLAQKQSGSVGSKFTSKISYPDSYKIVWKYPNDLAENEKSISIEDILKTDKFIGVAFTK